ncbi:hypothetical protein G6F40_015873 [Rhizopus arrhizus]|nr:hypothetical protein G6F40_015873 [Rhizopus arrhizus]
MHPFIHPLSEAVQPLLESKTDWEIYKLLAKKFSEIGGPYLGKRRDLVMTPLMHDTPGELGQAFEPRDWKLGECDLVPGKPAPSRRSAPCWTSWAMAARASTGTPSTKCASWPASMKASPTLVSARAVRAWIPPSTRPK